MIIKNDQLRYTLGVVYAPNEVDLQDEFSDEEEIRKASWKFMDRLQGYKLTKGFLEEVSKVLADEDAVGIVDVTDLLEEHKIEKQIGIMHKEFDPEIGTVVESFQAPVDMTVGDEEISKGSWLLGVVWSEESFQKVLSGELSGYSMGGEGVKIPVKEVK